MQADNGKGQRVSNRYKVRYGRLHDLENGVSYFIDPEDGIPKKVITQRSTKLDTVVGAAQSHYGTTREPSLSRRTHGWFSQQVLFETDGAVTRTLPSPKIRNNWFRH
jgi:hypothetical protein